MPSTLPSPLPSPPPSLAAAVAASPTTSEISIEIVWSDPWAVVGLVLFCFLCAIGAWRVFRRHFECGIERV